jgi:dTDP-4-amino-4,6-dideoxygalactose transaminase
MSDFKVNFIRNSYVRFYKKHKKEIEKAINGCFERGSLIAESEVEKFEKNFAKFCNRKYCITTSSGTDALKLACTDRKPFFLSDYRYRLPIANHPDFDCVLVTYMNSVVQEVPRKDHFIIEDACQAVGRKLIGDISCFSFYPAKMIGGIGKGGALVTSNKEVYEKLKAIRDDKWHNIWLDEVYASFLNVKLKHLPQILERRKKIADYYTKHLPKDIIWSEECLQNYIVIVKEHDKFIKFMRANGVEVISDKSDFYLGNLDNAVRLPIYAEMTDEEVKYVCKMVNKFYDK